MSYEIKIPLFEGPFDLLLFFIERDEIDIMDIPISNITKDFLDYIYELEKMNIEVASEFIVVAATLKRSPTFNEYLIDGEGTNITSALVGPTYNSKTLSPTIIEIPVTVAARLTEAGSDGSIRASVDDTNRAAAVTAPLPSPLPPPLSSSTPPCSGSCRCPGRASGRGQSGASRRWG